MHIQTAGSLYHGTELEKFDMGGIYLKSALKLFGIDDFTELYIEGVDRFRDQHDLIKKNAMQNAAKIAMNF